MYIAQCSTTVDSAVDCDSYNQPGVLFVSCQVDASQGSEEMVEHLSEKVLQQEEQLQQLEEEKNDLASFSNSVLAIACAV